MSHVDVLTAHSTERHKLSDGRFVEIELIEFCVTWPGKDAEMRLITRQDVGTKTEDIVHTSDGTCVVMLVPITADICYEAAQLLVSYAAQKHSISARQLRLHASDTGNQNQAGYCAIVNFHKRELSSTAEQLLMSASHLANTTAESVKKLADKAGHRLKDGASALSHKLRKSHHDDA